MSSVNKNKSPDNTIIIPFDTTNILRIKNKTHDKIKLVKPIVRISKVAFLEGPEIAIPNVKQSEKMRNIFKPMVSLKLVELSTIAGSNKKP